MEKDRWTAESITEAIDAFIGHSPRNNFGNGTGEKAFDGPLVGFAAGHDPIFESYREYVGPFHWTPLEAFRQTYPDSGVGAENLTVISWVLPQTQATKADNRREDTFPAERWVRARIFGEEVNNALRRHVAELLDQAGVRAVAPAVHPAWERKDSKDYVFASTWSERHAAYAAGLGTFGLCDGLITAKGKAMRVGSVVAEIKLEPNPRPYTDHHAYCLFYTQGICGKCIPRCPVGALSAEGHDKIKCREHVRGAVAAYVKDHYGFDGYGCGLCQTGVPCESKIPLKQDL